MKPPTISYLSNIYFEPGAISVLPQLLASLDIKNPLVVTDPGIIRAGLIKKLSLESMIVFDGVDANPSESNVSQGVDCYLKNNCDGIIAIGGGSPIDCAKCIAIMATHPKPLSDYAFAHGGLTKITNNQPPLIAVPTTSGTGSEVGRAALITFSNGTKLGILSPHLIPNAVVCDPCMTLGLPPQLTAATAMDAISHCIETYCSPRLNPIADAIALDGFDRAIHHVRQAVAEGDNLHIRGEMMMAALQGGMTFQKGLGVIHSLSHPLGALKNTRLHHGTLNAIFLPHVLQFNMDACPEQMNQLAQTAGLTHRNELPDFFTTLNTQIGLPPRLRDMGLDQIDFDSLSKQAFNDHCSATNPRKVTVEACNDLYQAAF